MSFHPTPPALPTLADLPAGDDHLIERPLSSEQVYRGRLLDVRLDHVSLPDGGRATREYIVHNGAVMVIPLLDDGRLLLERQYRYPLQRAMIEFPAGKLELGEPGIACAVRELREETGYEATQWAHAGQLHNAIAYATEHIQVWLARGLTAGERALDEGEFLDIFAATAEELAAWCRDGAVTDAKTLVGLLWVQQWRAGLWDLTWKSEAEHLAAG